MAKIELPNIDKTISNLKDILEKEYASRPEHRNPDGTRNIGASLIGNECLRKIWYYHKGYEQVGRTSYKGILAADDGNRMEDVMADLLRKVPGVELRTIDETTGRQFSFKRFEGLFKGFLDGLITGILEAPKKLHVWEHKCVNQEKFEKLIDIRKQYGEKNALAKWDFVYYTQANLYMTEYKTDRHYMTVCTPGCRDFISIRTELNKEFAESIYQKAKRIINSPRPLSRASNNPKAPCCKYCQFKGRCFSENA